MKTNNYKKLLKEHFSDISILYVEDEDETRTLICSLLRNYFIKVDEAHHGKEGLERLEASPYDLIISDISMPVMSGIEMAKTIKLATPKQTILMISAYNEADYLAELIDFGIDGFVVKPIDMQNLLEMIWKMCRKIKLTKKQDQLNNLLK